jgi:hypothetical protein
MLSEFKPLPGRLNAATLPFSPVRETTVGVTQRTPFLATSQVGLGL